MRARGLLLLALLCATACAFDSDAGIPLPAVPRSTPPALCDDDGLAACYELHEDLRDGTNQGNDAMLAGGDVVFGHEQGMTVTAPTDILIAERPTLDLTSITIEASLFLEGPRDRVSVIENDLQWGMFVGDDLRIECVYALRDGGLASVDATEPLAVMTWQRASCSYDEATGRARVRVDGALQTEELLAPGGLDVSEQDGTAIAGSAPFGDHFVGALKDIRIYSRAID